MDLDKTIETLKKDLEIFGLNHRCSKLELYRKYQQYIKKWKLDNFETMDEKLSASKKIDKAHEAYDFIKTHWNYLVLLKDKEDSYDRSIIIIVFVFLFIMMMAYMQSTANKRVRIAKQEAIGLHEANWAWTHGMSDSLVKLSKQNALDDFWGKVIIDTSKITDLLTFWPHTFIRLLRWIAKEEPEILMKQTTEMINSFEELVDEYDEDLVPIMEHETINLQYGFDDMDEEEADEWYKGEAYWHLERMKEGLEKLINHVEFHT